MKQDEYENMLCKIAYKKGFVDGLTAFAWSKDGQQLVGTCGTTLKEAIDKVETTWNYKP
jgi:hypothetical protein